MSSASHWTPEEDGLLRQRYPTATNAELQALFPSRPLKGIIVRASRIGVKKNLDIHETGLPFAGSVIGHLSETERAYLAGIIDGEGCISLHRRSPKGKKAPVYALYVNIANTSPALRKWLDDRFPNRIYYAPLHSNRVAAGRKKGYKWCLSGNRQVIVFLREIAPYLVIKKEQAEALVTGYLHLPEEERFALYQRLREMKKYA